MKKATSKRDRKYGKKNNDGVKVSKSTNDRIVKVMRDYDTILKFKNMKEARAYINKENKEADSRGLPRASLIII